jgi:hypothetical protein
MLGVGRRGIVLAAVGFTLALVGGSARALPAASGETWFRASLTGELDVSAAYTDKREVRPGCALDVRGEFMWSAEISSKEPSLLKVSRASRGQVRLPRASLRRLSAQISSAHDTTDFIPAGDGCSIGNARLAPFHGDPPPRIQESARFAAHLRRAGKTHVAFDPIRNSRLMGNLTVCGGAVTVAKPGIDLAKGVLPEMRLTVGKARVVPLLGSYDHKQTIVSGSVNCHVSVHVEWRLTLLRLPAPR